MGISRISRQKWLAVPMMAAAIGLSAPAAANAATTASAPTTTVAATSSATGSTPTTLRITPDQILAPGSVTETPLGSFRGDRRGADRWKKL